MNQRPKILVVDDLATNRLVLIGPKGSRPLTFATIDAAAIVCTRRSPFTKVLTSTSRKRR